MHIIYIFSDHKIWVMHRACLRPVVGQQSQHQKAPGLPPARGSPPHTPNDFVVLLFVHRHELYQLVIYMHEMMMQHLVI